MIDVLPRRPRNRSEVYRWFGDPGVGRVDPRWERAAMVSVKNLPEVPRGKLYVHRHAAAYLRDALWRVKVACPGHIHRIGCFSFRHQRHDETRPLSYHSWGIAVDVNPRENRARHFRRGEAPDPWTAQWHGIWPKGLPEPFVKAFQAAGWAWGGDWDGDGSASGHTYVDPMHFELIER